MKNRKNIGLKLFLLVMSLFTLSGIAYANERGEDRPFPNPHMIKKLNLTPEQVNQIKGIHEKHKKEMQDARAALKKVRQDESVEVQGVLTDKQKKQFSEMKEKWHESGEKFRGRKDHSESGDKGSGNNY